MGIVIASFRKQKFFIKSFRVLSSSLNLSLFLILLFDGIIFQIAGPIY